MGISKIDLQWNRLEPRSTLPPGVGVLKRSHDGTCHPAPWRAHTYTHAHTHICTHTNAHTHSPASHRHVTGRVIALTLGASATIPSPPAGRQGPALPTQSPALSAFLAPHPASTRVTKCFPWEGPHSQPTQIPPVPSLSSAGRCLGDSPATLWLCDLQQYVTQGLPCFCPTPPPPPGAGQDASE